MFKNVQKWIRVSSYWLLVKVHINFSFFKKRYRDWQSLRKFNSMWVSSLVELFLWSHLIFISHWLTTFSKVNWINKSKMFKRLKLHKTCQQTWHWQSLSNFLRVRPVQRICKCQIFLGMSKVNLSVKLLSISESSYKL
jgi:hypothetical protein